MPVPSRNQILPGSLVSIILKADQPTGRQAQGTVEDVLTEHDHPQGVEVLLTDGRVGRVQEVIVSGSASQYRPPQRHTPVPDPQNWQAHNRFPSGHSSAYSLPPQPQHAESRFSQAPLFDDSPNIPAEERSEQMEYLQSYEGSKPASQDDINQATLQKEFPNIDASLI